MIIEEVEIKNFRSHRSSKIKFDQGISVIVGDNGSGKTSILEAVNFALFKQKPNNINADDLIRRGTEEAEVSVTFHSNGRKYRVMRGRKLGKASGSALYQDEKLLVRGEDEVTLEVEKILGVNGELFTSAVYIKQGEIDGLISAAPAVRKEQVGRLLGAQDLENAYKNMRELIGEYDMRFEKFQTVPEDIKKTEEKIKKEKQEIAQLSEEIKIIERNLSEKRRRFEEKEKEIAQLEKLKDLLNAREKNLAEIENLDEKIKKIESYERELKETEKIHEEYAKLEQEIEALNQEKIKLAGYSVKCEQLSSELASQRKKAGELSEFIKSEFEKCGAIFDAKVESYEKLEQLLSKNMENIEEKLIEIREEKDGLTSKIGKLRGNNEEIERAVSELEEARDKCPVCGATLTEKHKRKLLEEYSAKIEKNSSGILRCEKKLENCTREESRLESQLRKMESINLEMLGSKIGEEREIKDEIEKISGELNENRKLLKNLGEVEKKLSENELEKAALKDGNERYIEAKLFLRKNFPDKEKFQEEIEKIRKRIESLETEIRKLRYAPEKIAQLDNLKMERSILQDELTKLEKDKSWNESTIKEKGRSIENLTAELEELKAKEKELNKLGNFKIFLGRIRELFHKDYLQRELRVKSRPLVEKYTREVFDRFNLPYSDIGITEDFNIVVYSQHGEESVDMLSGGERIAAALALRIGIARALSGSAMELIMLDEPTIHLDALRRRELVDIIKKLSSIPQTIVVTHDKEFENAADRLILVEKVEGVSQVRYEE
ncbi:MAG: AAA family ATPase [Euryarchaeota archaeon]|nr:AAA family ATPase [Euryarchaeota archaeon]